ncbi:MAG: ABC transporter ATP-binding protein [Bacteroidota bacterium]|nr:ABC transporter ATP-binding protein [Bacteroidota bacterium]
MIHIRDIHKSYITGENRLHVLKGIDLDIAEGEMISIMGASGSGKSTLLNILGILDNYDKGEYSLNGSKIFNLNEKKAARLRNQMLGFVFQSFNLISFKNAMENVALPLYYQKIGRKKRNLIAMEYLDRLGLKDWAFHLPSELSGGQKQRIAIARALITKPKVILADEPTGALDSVTSMEMMDLFEEINNSGITVVIVTHEHDISARTHRIIHITDGMITDIIKN